MKKEIMAIWMCTILLLVIFSSGCIDFGGEKKGEGGIDVDIDVSVDKSSFGSGEGVNITVTVTNNLNKTFPYGDYYLMLTYVDKADFDSGGGSHYRIKYWFTDSISVPPNETYVGSTFWNGTDFSGFEIQPGEYYIIFHMNEGTEMQATLIKGG